MKFTSKVAAASALVLASFAANSAHAEININGNTDVDTVIDDSTINVTNVGIGEADLRAGGIQSADGEDINIFSTVVVNTIINESAIAVTNNGGGIARAWLGGIGASNN